MMAPFYLACDPDAQRCLSDGAWITPEGAKLAARSLMAEHPNLSSVRVMVQNQDGTQTLVEEVRQ